MNMVIPNVGKLEFLKCMLRDDSVLAGGYNVKLYKNDYTPDDDSVVADFTEADFTGYAQIHLGRSDFQNPVILSNVAYSLSSITPIYDCTGGADQDVYGWFMTCNNTGEVLCAQRFDLTRTMAPGTEEALDPFRVALKTLA